MPADQPQAGAPAGSAQRLTWDRPVTVALLGGGTVGSQVARLLGSSADDLTARVGAPVRLTAVAVRDPGKARPGIDPGCRQAKSPPRPVGLVRELGACTVSFSSDARVCTVDKHVLNRLRHPILAIAPVARALPCLEALKVAVWAPTIAALVAPLIDARSQKRACRLHIIAEPVRLEVRRRLPLHIVAHFACCI